MDRNTRERERESEREREREKEREKRRDKDQNRPSLLDLITVDINGMSFGLCVGVKNAEISAQKTVRWGQKCRKQCEKTMLSLLRRVEQAHSHNPVTSQSHHSHIATYLESHSHTATTHSQTQTQTRTHTHTHKTRRQNFDKGTIIVRHVPRRRMPPSATVGKDGAATEECQPHTLLSARVSRLSLTD